jgi:hypothetical protein
MLTPRTASAGDSAGRQSASPPRHLSPRSLPHLRALAPCSSLDTSRVECYTPRPPLLTLQLFPPRPTAWELTTGAQDDCCAYSVRPLRSRGVPCLWKGADDLAVTCSLPPPPTPLPLRLLRDRLPPVRSGANSEWESDRGSGGKSECWAWNVKWECWRGRDSQRCNSGLVSRHGLSQRYTTVYWVRGERKRLRTERVRAELENESRHFGLSTPRL